MNNIVAIIFWIILKCSPCIPAVNDRSVPRTLGEDLVSVEGGDRGRDKQKGGPPPKKLLRHPAGGWLICTEGLLDANTGDGVVEINNSRDQNSQHGFQRFIFSMLSTAWCSPTDLFAAKSISSLTLKLSFQSSCAFGRQTDWKFVNAFELKFKKSAFI